jgi:hypothetical protein
MKNGLYFSRFEEKKKDSRDLSPIDLTYLVILNSSFSGALFPFFEVVEDAADRLES